MECTERLLLAPLLLLPACAAVPGDTADGGEDPIRAATESMLAHEGFVRLFFDPDEGRVLFEPPPESQDVLYYVSLTTGLGSNDVGLDRAQLSTQRLVHFRRAGRRVLLVAPNLDWRSSSEDPEVVRGVRESFAESVLFGFDPVVTDGERVLLDGTDFFLSDAHGIAGRLDGAGQGRFQLERSRSALANDGLFGFERNSDVEALLTFVGDAPGSEVRATAADPRSISFRVRHSFVALPALSEDDYVPRAHDPRSGYFPRTWHDVSAPIDAPLERRVIQRHRLTRDEPIVYYVDRAAPEPVRTALLEGARYWEPAFAAAGFPGGFRVELLPSGAHVQDVRYNVISWVNRSTRGWSYGTTVSDPRTGRILKGHVSLGALRVRQDVLLFEGLLSPYRDGLDSDERVRSAALARIRQLSAHEVGHTLGLSHNFAASANDRASVMDYPAPLVRLTPDGFDVERAYATGIGAWDELAIRYGYAELGADEEAGLAGVLDEMRSRGLAYLSDADARGGGRAHPLANLWDNGAEPLAELAELVRVRRAALDRLSERALVPGRALAELERTLVPLYLWHRYQLEAALRLLGGRTYAHAMVTTGGVSAAAGTPRVEATPPALQRAALEAALATLSTDFLALPDELVAKLLPMPPGSGRDRESFDPRNPLFDPLTAARAAVEHTLTLLLDPERAARLVDQPGGPDLEEVLMRLDAAVARVAPPLGVELEALYVDHLIRLCAGAGSAERVRPVVWAQLARIAERLPAGWQRARIERFLEDPAEVPLPRPVRVPPGSPIGCATQDGL